MGSRRDDRDLLAAWKGGGTVSFDDQLGGSLSDLIKKRGGRLLECEVQYYTMMILKGLCGIHEMGVHSL
ncbi:hypothetical protein Ddye_007680 [Dipteronia dyeriana]|uniref:Uncharacterized protein n=1 Tax=Dipteronia dyeriana TaxID=168575 RepID=A0AAD9XKP7_9ROSI|nr:hypothetical protein Ddye_007680 [Dipteronia dyeriana]